MIHSWCVDLIALVIGLSYRSLLALIKHHSSSRQVLARFILDVRAFSLDEISDLTENEL